MNPRPFATLNLLIGLAAAIVSFVARPALAEQPPAAIPDGPPPAAAPEPTPTNPAPPIVIEPAPLAPPPPAPAVTMTTTAVPPAGDHQQFVGHFGVGYQGISSLPIAAGGAPGALPQLGTVSAPVIGIRYWFRESVGFDAGLGIGIQTGSAQPSAYGFALHTGLPIALAHGRHSVFEIIPEATVGFTTGTIAGQPGVGVGTNASVGGFLVRAGARAGAELHFGFIGLPELALQATVGLYWRTETFHWDQAGTSTSATSTLITTSVNDAPWGIFTDTVSALYYF